MLVHVHLIICLKGISNGRLPFRGAVIVSFEGNLHFNKLGTPFGTFDHAISAYGTIGTEDVKYGLSKGKWEVEFTGIATAANGDMYSVVDGATLAFSVTK